MLKLHPNSEKTLTTARLILEPLTTQHAIKLFEKFQDSKLYTYIPVDPPASIQEFEARLVKLSSRSAPGRADLWLNWAARLRNSADDYVGYFQATIHENDTAAISYTVFSDLWRNGFALESCDAVIEHLFQDYALKKVYAEIDIRNNASIRLVKKLGFIRVGHRDNADFFKDNVSHEYLYELSAFARGNWVLKRIKNKKS